MKKPEIAPGEWYCFRKQAKYWSEYLVCKKGGGIIADCHTLEKEATAITALPDLLEALERAVSIIEDLPHPENIPAQDLRQALVKAGYTFE